MTLITQHETLLRGGIFLGIYFIMLSLESMAPRKVTKETRFIHNLRNMGIVAADTLIVRLMVPILPAGVAVLAAKNQLGLMNVLETTLWLNLIVTIVLFDLAIYAQHIVFHRVDFLWRLHKVHHSDIDLDASSGLRFHPIEILLSLMIKMILVLVTGASAEGVILFEIILNGMAVFNHANVALPLSLDRVLRILFVTPDVHRVHHSVYKNETDSNFGFNLSIWDRLFGTYIDQPDEGHEGMEIGIPEYRHLSQLTFWRLMSMPFKHIELQKKG